MTIFKRLLAALAIATIGLGLAATPATAQPIAQAGPVHASAFPNGCPQPGGLCLYENTSYDNKWQTTVYNFDGGANWPLKGPCWNLSGSTYAQGTYVNNSASSYTVTENIAYEGYYWIISDWVSCQGAGPQLLRAAWANYFDPTFLVTQGSGQENWNNRPTSVQLVCIAGVSNGKCNGAS